MVLGGALLVVILVSGLLSFVQETGRANVMEQVERALPQVARVVREGEEHEVASEDVVMGDVLLLRSGDRVAADCRIIEADNFAVDNSALTGESEPQVIAKRSFQG